MNYLFFDLRALGLMRICVAIVIIIDLSIRITDLETFYANSGATPLPMIFEYAWNKYFISFHAISGLKEIQFILFLVAYLFAFLLLIGFRTQLFTFLSWLMMLSLHNRNCLILQGGDDLLRMVLFWGNFLPWGVKYSYDSIYDTENVLEQNIRTPATIAYLLQICYLYTGSALLKGKEWDTDFTALYYVYNLDQIAYPITSFLLPHESLLKVLTAVAYYFELWVPALFFIPYFHGFFRTLGVLLIITFHTLNELTLLVGLFPYIGIATSLGVLPSRFMDVLEKMLSKSRNAVIFVFATFGTFARYWIPWRKPDYNISWVTNGVLIFLIVYIFDWNYSNLSFVKSKISDNARVIGYLLRLDQSWGMFAPGVLKDDGWYILKGKTEDKKYINTLNPDKKLTYKKPEAVVKMFKNDRWRKYYEHLMLADHTFMRGYYCNYTKRIWNEKYPSFKITSLDIIYMHEFTLPNYTPSKAVPTLLWRCE